MDNETKKRKLEKLRDKISGDPQEISRIVERLDGLNARMLELAQLLEKRASVQVENLNEIRFPSSFSIQNIKDFPTTLSILNFPNTQKVAMDKPDWWQDPQAFPQKIAIDWENAPRQKQDKPDWIDSIVSIALTSISTILAKLWTTPLQTERTEGDRLKPQMMILLDGKTGKPLSKEDLRPLVNVEQRMPPSGASSGGAVGSDVNVTDRAARLLGIIYGSQAQLQQKATSFELLTWDKNLEAVLGTVSLLNAGRIMTEATQAGAWSVSITGTPNVSVTNFPATQPISAVSLPLPTGAATETTLAAFAADLGDQADAEATGNGSLIAITKRLRTLLAAGLPAALVSGRLDVNVGNTPTVTTKSALTGSAPTAATVGTSSAQAVATNANRKGLVLTNLSGNTISFGLGAAAVLNNGITLTPFGIWVMDEYTFTTQAINAIASAAGSALAVQEFT